MSVSFDSLDFGFSGEDLVKVEAISNCEDKKWASFLCISTRFESSSGQHVKHYKPCIVASYLISLQLQIGLFLCFILTAENLDLSYSPIV